jgi:hypothetical protein
VEIRPLGDPTRQRRKENKPISVGNKYSLSDQSWGKEGNGYVHRSMFKMVPAMHAFNPMKKYQVNLNNGLTYQGIFKYYIYRKETPDSPLIRVYLGFKLDVGEVEFPEDSVTTFFRVE